MMSKSGDGPRRSRDLGEWNMDGAYQRSGQQYNQPTGYKVQQECSQQPNRITTSRGSLGGASQTPGLTENCAGAGLATSSSASWIPTIRQSHKISYRPIRPSDLDVLKEMHEVLFPVKYEAEFFLNVVNNNGIVSWAAVDTSRADPQHDEIIGFVTTRVVAVAEIDTAGMLGYEVAKADRKLIYILTLGVIKPYRKLGIASSLLSKVLEYASSIPVCRAVYLHVISYNLTAIQFYEKNSFRCLQKLQNFYYITGCHYDAYLYIYYVNGGRSPCSILDFLISMNGVVRNVFTSVAGRFWTRDTRKSARWSKYKELGGLFGPLRRIDGPNEGTASSCV